MVRSPDSNCPLCPPACSERDEAQVWYALQRSGGKYEVSAQKASELGYPCTAKQAARHFSPYHRPVQPSAQGYLKREKALAAAEKLPERRREIMLLCGRVRGLSATQIAELFFWTGEERQMTSARSAAYRDLRKLIYGDFVYHHYPEPFERPLAGRDRGRIDRRVLHFLGREGSPFAAQIDGYAPDQIPFIKHDRDLPSEYRLLSHHDNSEIVCSLARQLKVISARHDQIRLSDVEVGIRFDPLNWFDGYRMTIPLSDHVGKRASLIPGGLFAFGISSAGTGVLAPAFYEYDAATKPSVRFAGDLLAYARLQYSSALSELLPALPAGYVPPVLLVCNSPARLQSLQKSFIKLARKTGVQELPRIFGIDERTLRANGLLGDSWVPLWRPLGEGARRSAVDIMLRGAHKLFGQPGLGADDRLQYVAPEHLRPQPEPAQPPEIPELPGRKLGLPPAPPEGLSRAA